MIVPQITGGTLPPGPVSENVSVRQLLAKATRTAPAAGVILPPISAATAVATVVGPAMTKELKSIRI